MNPKGDPGADGAHRRLRTDGGYTVMVIEHDMHVVEGISIAWSRSTTARRSPRARSSECCTNERVVEAYLGLQATAK